jgi:hypothetical protein
MVGEEWLRRVEAEYRSAAATQELTLWLTQLGAPLGLVRLGLRVASDELTHAELSADVHRAAGGTQSPRLERDTLGLPRTKGGSLEQDVLRIAVEQFCLGETAAVRIFSRMQKHCEVQVVRRALNRILRDEVVHRDFGWELLAWLLQTPAGPSFRALVAAELPAMLVRQRATYGGAALQELGHERLQLQRQSLPPTARAWGVISILEYGEAIEETVARDYAPRFADLSLSLPVAQAGTAAPREPSLATSGDTKMVSSVPSKTIDEP